MGVSKERKCFLYLLHPPVNRGGRGVVGSWGVVGGGGVTVSVTQIKFTLPKKLIIHISCCVSPRAGVVGVHSSSGVRNLGGQKLKLNSLLK